MGTAGMVAWLRLQHCACGLCVLMRAAALWHRSAHKTCTFSPSILQRAAVRGAHASIGQAVQHRGTVRKRASGGRQELRQTRVGGNKKAWRYSQALHTLHNESTAVT
jgi:hypothetical protein